MQGFEIESVEMRQPRFKSDRGSTLSFNTGELGTKEKYAVLELGGSLGTLIFMPEEVTLAPQKLEGAFEGKTPSERLRNVLYVYWMQQGGEEKGMFQEFYTKQMERFIEATKVKLDD